MYISTGQGDVFQQRNITGRRCTSVEDKEMYCSKGISQVGDVHQYRTRRCTAAKKSLRWEMYCSKGKRGLTGVNIHGISEIKI